MYVCVRVCVCVCVCVRALQVLMCLPPAPNRPQERPPGLVREKEPIKDLNVLAQ